MKLFGLRKKNKKTCRTCIYCESSMYCHRNAPVYVSNGIITWPYIGGSNRIWCGEYVKGSYYEEVDRES